jgi:hypothetical protein
MCCGKKRKRRKTTRAKSRLKKQATKELKEKNEQHPSS